MSSGLWSAFSFRSEWGSLTAMQPALAHPQGAWERGERKEIVRSVHRAMVTCDWLQTPSEVTADREPSLAQEGGAARARPHGGQGLTGS